jgi:hypothetical protein
MTLPVVFIPRTIPALRARLHVIASELLARGLPLLSYELHCIAEETRRRPYKRAAKPRAQKLTPRLKARIAAYKREHPDAHQEFDIAPLFKVAGGRITDSVRGKRGEAP